MSHKIAGDSIFYYGEKPWHGIGTELDHPATAVEAIQAAKLNFNIVKEKLTTESGVIVPNRYATVRSDTNQVLGLVSDNYQIIQNTDAFSFFDSVVGEGKAIYHTAGALGNGEQIWILAKLPKDIIIKNVDNVEKYLLLTNSHTGKKSLVMYFTPTRVVCWNTLVMSLQNRSAEGISISHVGNLKDKVEEAVRLLGLANEFYNELGRKFGMFADRQLKASELKDYLDIVVYDPQPEIPIERTPVMENRILKMTDLFETGKGNDVKGVRGTLWAAMNSVTEYVDHYRSQTDTDASKLNNVWFGAGSRMKQRSFEAASALIGVKS